MKSISILVMIQSTRYRSACLRLKSADELDMFNGIKTYEVNIKQSSHTHILLQNEICFDNYVNPQFIHQNMESFNKSIVIEWKSFIF